MAFSGKLAELFIDFVSRGVDVFKNSVTQIETALSQTKASVTKLGELMDGAFGRARLAVMGFVTAGLAMSSWGQVMGYQMERLSRTVAGLFGPEIKKVIDLLNQLNNWFQGLSETQRKNIAHWVEGIAVALLVVGILPRVIGVLQGVIAGVRALTVALMGSGWGAILPIIGFIAAAFLGIGAGAEVAEEGFGGLLDTLKPILDLLKNLVSTLTTAFAPLADTFKEVFGQVTAVVGELIQSFGKILIAVEPVIKVVGDGLVVVLKALSDVLTFLVDLIDSKIIKWGLTVLVMVKVFTWTMQIIKAFWLMVEAVKALNIVLGVQVVLESILAALTGNWASLAVAAVVAAGAAIGTYYLINSAEEDLENKRKEREGKKTNSGEMGGRGMLPPRLSGMEAPEKIWDRLAVSAMKMGIGGKSPEQIAAEQLTHLEHIDEHTAGTKKAVETQKPTFAMGGARS